MRHLILDGYNLIHRARGGFQKGDWPIVFNFFRGLRPVVERFSPVDSVSFILEGSPARQLAILPEYKGNRGSEPDGFGRQRDAIVSILRLMPIRTFYHPDFEADDLVHNLITRLDGQISLVSSDSDFTQLLQRDLRPSGPGNQGSDRVSVWNWRTDEILIRPDHDYVMWKALRGDGTDNIPKCPGMGDKTALMTIQDLNRFAAAMQDPAVRVPYERNLGLIRFYDMTDDEWSQCEVSDPVDGRWDEIKARFESFGFRSMLKDSTWSKWTKTFDDIGT